MVDAGTAGLVAARLRFTGSPIGHGTPAGTAGWIVMEHGNLRTAVPIAHVAPAGTAGLMSRVFPGRTLLTANLPPSISTVSPLSIPAALATLIFVAPALATPLTVVVGSA